MKKKQIMKNQDGSALIPVLCVLCILAAFVLTMVFASYQVLTQAQRAATKEQCRLSAITFSEQFQKQLEEDDTDDENKLNGLQQDLHDKITGGSWQYYNKDEDGHSTKADVTRTFDADMKDTNSKSELSAGHTTVKMYWESSKAIQDNNQYGDIVLVVKVTTKLRGQQYTVTTQYELRKPGTESVDWTDIGNWKWAHSWSGQ